MKKNFMHIINICMWHRFNGDTAGYMYEVN